MKNPLLVFALTSSTLLFAQSSDNPFEGTFDDMFTTVDGGDWYIPEDNPPPPVPLDGGLTALLLAGGAAGYRQYQKKTKA
jgi:hypothetical protein